MSVADFAIRQAIESDAAELARLLTALGHPTLAEEVTARWSSWSAAGNRALVASRDDSTLAASITIGRMFVLHRPKPVGRITSLIVDSPDRGRGIGRALVTAAEEELSRQGCGLLEITSNDRLVEAHRFYEHLGYRRTSIRLVKDLTAQ